MKHRLYLFFLFLIPFFAKGQSYSITGTVKDADTGEPVPYATILVTGKFVGTNTDSVGRYKLQLNKKIDSLTVSAIGYTSVKKAVTKSGSHAINFELKYEDIGLAEVIISADKDPAEVIFKKIIRNKHLHDLKKLNTATFESYTKYEIDLDNVTQETIDDNILFSRFPFLKGYIDSNITTGSTVLPIFLIEQLSDNYVQTDPSKQQEIMKGVKLSGLKQQDFITEMLSNVNQHLYIYENLLGVMGKNLISPIADYGLTVYKYDVNIYDTLYVLGIPHFKMKFKPRRKDDLAFNGTMLVSIEDYAVTSVELELPDGLNINLIQKLKIVSSFQPYVVRVNEDSSYRKWLPAKEYLQMSMIYPLGKGMKIIGKKTKTYKDFSVDEPIAEGTFDPLQTTTIQEEAYTQSDTFWEASRHEALSTSEAGIYEMVDSLKKTKTFKVIMYAVSTLASGYARVGKISFGHVGNVFSRNQVEGWRFKLGMKTTERFSKRMQFEIYGAYGLKDERFKYGGEAQFIISRRPWMRLALSGRTDLDLMSRHAEEFDRDNVFTIIPKQNSSAFLYNADRFKISYDLELHKDLVSYLTLSHQKLTPMFDFGYLQEGELKQQIYTSEVGLAFRWQYKQKPLSGVFNREAKANRFFAQFRKKNSYPVFWFKYVTSIPKVLNSNFTLHDFGLGIQGDFAFTAKQSIYYNVWTGKILGELPFLLLKNPEGNFSYVHNKYYFNNMNLMEFSADQYVSLNFQYFMGGIIADKIPLIKKLKLRGVWSTNIFYGTMNEKNRQFNSLNTYDIAAPTPYIEAGFGIENILKFIRIDYIHRFTYRDNPGIVKWGIYASLFIKP